MADRIDSWPAKSPDEKLVVLLPYANANVQSTEAVDRAISRIHTVSTQLDLIDD